MTEVAGARGAPSAEPGAPDPFDSSSRLSLLMGTVWLLFLGFAIAAIWTSTHHPGIKALGLGFVAAFAVVYTLLYVRSTSSTTVATTVDPWVVSYLGLMTILALGIGAVAGMDAIGLTTYFIAGSMFALPVRWSWAVALTALAVSLLVPLALDLFSEWGFMVGINVAILLGTGIARFYAGRAEEYQAMQRQQAVVGERERVARDVHDVLGHSLTVIALKTELAERLMDVDQERARAELREANSLARAAIGEVRATVGGLRVRQLGEELVSSRSALEEAGLEVTVLGDPADVDPRHRILFAWALREATTNVLRHSGAGRVEIRLAKDQIGIMDDGAGLAGRAEGHGLRGLRERVEEAGGVLTVSDGATAGAGNTASSSTPAGAGTYLEVTM